MARSITTPRLLAFRDVKRRRLRLPKYFRTTQVLYYTSSFSTTQVLSYYTSTFTSTSRSTYPRHAGRYIGLDMSVYCYSDASPLP